MKIGINILSKGIKYLSKNKNSKNLVEQTANIISAEKKVVPKAAEAKELFCHEYWKDALAEGLIKKDKFTSVPLHGYLNSINHHFIRSAYPKHMDMKNYGMGDLTPREMIFKSDFAFKSLSEVGERLTAYRSIGEKPEFFAEYKIYQKARSIKKGDIINMPEYAYATQDKGYASRYLTNNRGIFYEIDIPENAKVSKIGIDKNDEIVFPRSSKFECLETKEIKNADNDYLFVKLKYLVPEDNLFAK